MDVQRQINEEHAQYRNFLISVSLVIALGLSGVFLGLGLHTRDMINDEILASARAHFRGIVLTRKWNASYGGVYVLKSEGVLSNPYLRDPDIEARDGRVLTLRNPALMTREISALAEEGGLYKFSITSLKVLNPANEPDEFEARSLQLFEQGVTEYYERVSYDNSVAFRYMAPLYVEEPCLGCHAEQGYKVGQVRGGISVSFDIADIQGRLRRSLYAIVFFTVTTISISLALVYMFMQKLVKKLSASRRKIIEIAIKDDLTGLYNRRHLGLRFQEEVERALRHFKPLTCILMDLDHFKSVNDNFGHAAGDEVLRKVSDILLEFLRSYDIVGRYGGEEFLAILPQTEITQARELAERLRLQIRESVQVGGKPVTMSFGVSSLGDGKGSVEGMIEIADNRLYIAKAEGRDRVV